MTDLWIATSNQGKLSEFKSLIPGFQIHSPKELSFYAYPKETGKTFLENARLKAKSFKALKSDQWVLGEDSGLMVEALSGLPGIHSARYAGEKASDGENNAKLLKMMQLRAGPNRSAKFVCSIVVYSPAGKEYAIEAELSGQIGSTLKGQSGFGYDALFIPEGETKTLGEMDPAKKNLISHRAKALKQLLEILKAKD